MSGHDGNSSDTLVVPFAWVPEDAPEPTEWLMRHPDAFRVPARLEQDGPSTATRQRQAAGSDRPGSMDDGGNTTTIEDSSDSSTWPAPNNPRRRPSAYWLTATGAGATDPVRAYLHADGSLPRTVATPPTMLDGEMEREPRTPVEPELDTKPPMQDAAAHSGESSAAAATSSFEQAGSTCDVRASGNDETKRLVMNDPEVVAP